MTLLNPFALLLLLPIFFIFRDKFFDKNEFLLNTKVFNRQTKMLIFALIFSIIALSRPALQNQLTKQKFDANEYIVAIDVSFSMQADDIKPTRFEVAKSNIISLLQNDIKNRYSILAFTTNPLLICPPTTDKIIAMSALKSLVPKYILTKGTSLQNLLEFVAKMPQERKNLIIFSDGGDEHDIEKLLSIAKKSAITINIVAVASKKGIALKKLSQHLHDSNGALVISRINPILEELAYKSGGIYLEVNNTDKDISKKLLSKIDKKKEKQKDIKTDIVSYEELYHYPLILSFILILLALTQLQKYIPFLALTTMLYIPVKSYGSMFDFYYLKEANKAYSEKRYIDSSNYFKKLSPSIESYINIATSYYKARKYSEAMRYYSLIESTDPKIKQMIFYNMGNCAVKLKKYDRAKTYYQQALALGFDKDAYENLMTLYKLGIKAKIDVADMLPKPNAQEKKNSSKKSDSQKDDEQNDNQTSGGGKSNQSSSISSSGLGDVNKKQTKTDSQHKQNASQNRYQMGYRAYELINKGYTNETNPW